MSPLSVHMQLQLYLKVITILKSSNRVGSHVVQNFRTVMVYHVLRGLLPQLGAGPPTPAISTPSAPPGSADRHDPGGGVGLTKLLGHVKFSVPLVDWTHQAFENLRVLCEELASEESDDVSIVLSSIVLLDTFVVFMGVLIWGT